MTNPSLRDLPGFPSPYLGFLEGIPEPGHIPPNRPEKGPLLSRCGAASRRAPPPAVILELARKVAPTASGSCLWSENIEKLERHRAVVIGASADAAGFNTSLLPLLRCLTAIRLAAEISLDGVSAVPLLWLNTAHRQQVDNAKEAGKVGPVQASSGQLRESGGNLVDYMNNGSKVSTNLDLYPNGCREVIMRLVHELGLVVIDSASTGFVLNHTPELSELRQRVIRICRQESAGQTVDDEPGCDPVIPGQTSVAVLLRLALPLGAEVVGPEDYDTAVQVGNLVGSAGNAKPFLWPRVSATVVDRRSCRTMEKYRLELPDLFRGGVAMSERLGIDRTASDVSNRLELLAGNIRRRIDDICLRAARDPRAVRRIRASGSRMLYQLRKLAVRSRQSADAHQDIAARQFEGLCSRVAPGGGLQEGRLSATQFLSAHSGPILQALSRRIDVWDLKHQLIAGLD